jgi:hypothetical protein
MSKNQIAYIVVYLLSTSLPRKKRKLVLSLLETRTLPSVFTLGKEPFALGKVFVECGTRQSPLGNIFIGKGTLPSVFLSGHSVKYFYILPSARPPAVNGHLAECTSSTRQFFFIFFTLPSVPSPALGKGFFFIFLNTLSSATGPALGKVFLFFLKHFAECHRPGTRQNFFLFFKYFAECHRHDTQQSLFLKKTLLYRVPPAQALDKAPIMQIF